MSNLLNQVGAAVRTEMESAIVAGNETATLQVKVNDKREGVYSHFMAVGHKLSESGTQLEAFTAFKSLWDSLCEDILHNAHGIARKLKCKANKRNKKGGTTYKVPSSAVQAAHIVRAALELGIPFTDAEGERASFGKVRDAVREAQQAAKLAQLSKGARDLHEAIESLRNVAASYAESFMSIVKNDDSDAWANEGLAAVTAAIEAAQPWLEATKATIAESNAEAEAEAGETVAAEAEKPAQSKRKAS